MLDTVPCCALWTFCKIDPSIGFWVEVFFGVGAKVAAVRTLSDILSLLARSPEGGLLVGADMRPREG